MIKIRKGQAPARLVRAEFTARFRASFIDPTFRAEDLSIARLEEIAWQAYTDGRKAPCTQKVGPGYADPDYNLSTEWIATKQRLDAAQLRRADPVSPSRVLLFCGSARNVTRAVAKAAVELRAGRLQAVQPAGSRPRPK